MKTMRKIKMLAVLLASALAVCAVAMVGCGSNVDKMKTAFEADPYVTAFEVNSDYVVDSPYSVTSFEVVNEVKSNGVTSIEFTAALENESFKADVAGVAYPGEDDTFIFNVYGDPAVTAKKGIDFLSSEEELLSADEGYTVSFDEASQSCVVTADKAAAQDFGFGTLYKTGKEEYLFEDGRWHGTDGDWIKWAIDWNADAIEGTYILETKKPDTPETIVISNVQANPEDLLGATFTVEYSFDGVDVKNEGTISAWNHADNELSEKLSLEAIGKYPPVNDDVDYIKATMTGYMDYVDGKVILEDVGLRSSERVEDGLTIRVSDDDPLDVGRAELVYAKQ